MTVDAVSLVDDDVPRVWIGCLHHYAAGFLVGHWFNAIDADRVSLADVIVLGGRFAADDGAQIDGRVIEYRRRAPGRPGAGRRQGP